MQISAVALLLLACGQSSPPITAPVEEREPEAHVDPPASPEKPPEPPELRAVSAPGASSSPLVLARLST